MATNIAAAGVDASREEHASLSRLTFLSLKAVLTVAACASAGGYLTHIGILEAKEKKILGKIVSEVFLPALILEKTIPNVSFGVIHSIWPLIVSCVLVVLYGLGSGYVVGKRVLRLSEEMRGLLMVAVGFPNSFSVPMTLMLAIPESEFQPTNNISSRIKLLFLLSYTLWVLARWSIGYPILSGALSFEAWRKKVMNPPVKACLLGIILGLVWNEAIPSDWRENVVTSLRNENEAPKSEDVNGMNSGGENVSPFHTLLAAFLQIAHTALDYAGRCCVPCILISLGANLYEAAVETFGGGSFSVLSGGSLFRSTRRPGISSVRQALMIEEVSESQVDEEVISGVPESAGFPLSANMWVLFLRQILGPVFAGIVCYMLKESIDLVDNRMVLMVGFLQGAGPPMINLSVMAGINENSAQSLAVAKLLLLTYAFSILSWTVAIAGFLHVF